MIRLTVSDFDGTLMPYGEKCVSPSVISAINRVTDNGITFAVSSGRTYTELLTYLPELSDKAYFICCDGALCVYKNKVIYSRHIADEDLRFLLAYSDKGASLIFHAVHRNYSLGALPRESEICNCTPIRRLSDINEKIYKVTAYGAEIKLPPYTGLRTHWDGGEYSCTQLVNRYCDKGAALSDLQMRLMLTKYDTACIGDSGNDVAMMKGAKYSFCVGEKCEELVRACTFRVGSAGEALGCIADNCK